MNAQELRDYVFPLVKKHGGKKAKEILSKEIDKNDDLMIAFARHGAKIVDAFVESESTLLN